MKLLKKLLFFVGVLASFSGYAQSKAAFAAHSHNDDLQPEFPFGMHLVQAVPQ